MTKQQHRPSLTPAYDPYQAQRVRVRQRQGLLLLLAVACILVASVNRNTAHSNTRDAVDYQRQRGGEQTYARASVPVIALPRPGSNYIDPIFGTSVRRLSNASAMPDNADTGRLAYVTPEYPTVSPFNADNGRLLLQHFSYFALYDGEGRYLKDLPFEIHASSEPRWSRHDPAIFYYLSGNELKSYNVNEDRARTLHEFSEYERISGMGEADISHDGRHRVLIGDDQEIFVFSLTEGRKSEVLRVPDTGMVDNLHITPSNKVLVGWYPTGTERFQGLELFDGDMSFIEQVAPALGHMDLTVDEKGNDLLLMVNSADPGASTECLNAIISINLDTGRRDCLLRFDWNISLHISATPDADHAIISTYTSNTDNPDQALLYQNEILRLSLPEGEIERMVHHRSVPHDNYSFMPRATMSQDGRLVVFASNHDRQANSDLSARYTDTYLFDIAQPVCESNFLLCALFPSAASAAAGAAATVAGAGSAGLSLARAD